MKTKMFLATATAALILMGSNVSASEPLLSPKAKELADSLAKVPGATTDMVDRSIKAGSPKHVAFVESLRKERGTTPDVTIVRHASVSTPKHLVR
ncbi:MAG: hypothetical protein FD161_3589 [Limisphaerales bacterium]|nr:MAG: hypothetical protein FD161_3589 [Limisphaerales bacterium]KAG0507587.1 MAG: hypothetical protein E1N63_3255 [Limisphaerales bacterium]TXT48552.1 MAG: hypothetical protein FD140_3630 [Limisphaerales bacterium]